MQIETLKKAEEFKQGHFNLVQYFLKKGCTFSVKDIETDKMTVQNSLNYEEIKKAINDYETHLEIFKDNKMISRVWIIPYNEGIDIIADYLVSKEIDTWADKFEKTMEHFINASLFSETDNLQSVSSRVMVGRVISGGTGIFELLLDTDKIKNTEYSEDETGGITSFTNLKIDPLFQDLISHGINNIDFFIPE